MNKAPALAFLLLAMCCDTVQALGCHALSTCCNNLIRWCSCAVNVFRESPSSWLSCCCQRVVTAFWLTCCCQCVVAQSMSLVVLLLSTCCNSVLVDLLLSVCCGTVHVLGCLADVNELQQPEPLVSLPLSLCCKTAHALGVFAAVKVL